MVKKMIPLNVWRYVPTQRRTRKVIDTHTCLPRVNLFLRKHAASARASHGPRAGRNALLLGGPRKPGGTGVSAQGAAIESKPAQK